MSIRDILAKIESVISKSLEKISNRNALSGIVADKQKDGKLVGFTSGSFDLLHSGHLDYLEKARSQSDCLIVGINSDASVRSYKDEKRPIIREFDRARLIAGLHCVDYVFVFSELNNNQNITILKPDLYFKAGDYSKEKLSSAPIIEEIGGKVVIIPFLEGYSTSSIIDNIIFKYSSVNAESTKLIPSKKMPAIFLDRDGTINESVEYLHEPEKFKLLPGVVESLKRLKIAGYRLVIVTNQPGIGLGYFTKEELFLVHKKFLHLMNEGGVQIDKIYFCPHAQSEDCPCRKPKTQMIERAVTDLNIDLTNSFVIGDMTGDLQLAKNAGCKSILVKTGFSGSDRKYNIKPDFNVDSLVEAANLVIKKERILKDQDIES